MISFSELFLSGREGIGVAGPWGTPYCEERTQVRASRTMHLNHGIALSVITTVSFNIFRVR
jgi:hypothetical protein